MSNKRHGKIFIMIHPLIISGPSGVGKTYLEKYLIANHNFQRIQSTITRPIRKGEVNGVDYNFITEKEYKDLEKQNKFITSAFALGCWRGFEKRLVEEISANNHIPITVVVPTVVPQFLNAYPDTIAIYLKPESEQFLIRRMNLRGDPPESIESRLEHEKEELEYFNQIEKYYKKIFNVTDTNFNQIVEEILKLTAE